VIDNNTVLGVPNNYLGTNNTWIKVSATNARVVHNLANSIDFRTSTGLVRDNVATHWQAKGGTVPYAKIFTNAWAGPSASINDFLVKSPYAGKGASLMPLYAAGAGRDTTPPSESPPAKQQMPAVPRPPAAVPHDRAPAEPQHQKRTDLLLPASASLPKLEALEPGKIAGTLPRIESSVGIPPRPETKLLPHGSETILTLLELLG
jgi:hypothetical protein